MSNPLLEEFKRNLAIVEGRSVPGSRSMSENMVVGIVPLYPIAQGVISGAPNDVELQLPECLEPLNDQQIHALVQAAEHKGVTAEQFFQIADELGQKGVQELLGEEVLQEILGTVLAGVAAYKGLKALHKHITDPKRIARKTKMLKAKAGLNSAKASHYMAKTDKIQAKSDFKATKARLSGSSEPDRKPSAPQAVSSSKPASAAPAKPSFAAKMAKGAAKAAGRGIVSAAKGAAHVAGAAVGAAKDRMAAKAADRGAHRQMVGQKVGKAARPLPSSQQRPVAAAPAAKARIRPFKPLLKKAPPGATG